MTGLELTDFPFLVVGVLAEIKEKSEKKAMELVEKGKTLSPCGRERAEEAKIKKEALTAKGMQITDELAEAITRTMEKVLGKMGVITKSDIEALDEKLNSLANKMENGTKSESEKKEVSIKG